MKTKYISILTTFSLAALSSAATIRVSSLTNLDGSAPDTLILSAANAPLAFGIVGTGKFSVNDAAVDLLITSATTTGDYSGLISAFDSFVGTDDFATGVDFIFGIGSVPGAFALGADLGAPTAHIGATLYSFFGNAATLSGSTEFGLYRHSEKLVADPAQPTPPNDYNLLLTGGSLLIGTSTSFVSTDTNLGTNGDSMSAIKLVAAVPEPSAALLGAIGAMALLRRRRN
jgi:hypothetical protein